MHGVKITVVSVGETPCGSGIKVGDSWQINCNGESLRMSDFQGACPELINTILPQCLIMAYEGKLAWEKDGKATSCCPDPASQVIVSYERIPLETWV
ncbi:MAG: TIGR04076 family protein [Clostridia bacterium]